MTYRKKLIEVALPLEAINIASAREKSIRHGHPSTLHLWWARRPLAAARAVIFAQMVDDPSEYVDELLADPATRQAAEEQYNTKIKAWEKRKNIFEQEENAGTSAATNPDPGAKPTLHNTAAELERDRLFQLIEQLVLWENTTNEIVLQQARDEIWRSWRRTCRDNVDHPQASELFNPEKLPAFHDPFAGGGALPLEAQRLGLEAYASDLNPVAVLINKAMIEIPPRFAGKPPVNADIRNKKMLFDRKWVGSQGLAEDIHYYGIWIRTEAEKRIGHLYPKVKISSETIKERPELKEFVGQELTVIAWLWARTVKSPNPAFANVDVPLITNFMVSTKKGNEAYIHPIINTTNYRFTIKTGKPKEVDIIQKGTKLERANFVCIMSGVPITGNYIKSEGKAGRMGVRIMAVVAETNKGRIFLAPTDEMEEIAKQTRPEWEPENELLGKCRDQLPLYGVNTFAELFTKRQLVALTTFSDLIKDAHEKIRQDALAAGYSDEKTTFDQGGNSSIAYADAIGVFLAFAVDRTSNTLCTGARWTPERQQTVTAFSRQAIQMTWDFPEVNPFAGAAGDFEISIGGVIKGISNITEPPGFAQQADAACQNISQNKIISTDPPYYDNINYADLSDFFYLWMRRSLRNEFPDLFSTVAVPKIEELVASPYRHNSKEEAEKFFLDGMTKAMSRLAKQSLSAFPVTIYYAFKQSENNGSDSSTNTGWDTFLAAIIQAGFDICGTWPMRTEMGNRMIGSGANALASSIVLVCRKKIEGMPTSTRRDFLTILKKEMPIALTYLQASNIAPVDLAQAAIGPGMAIYTRFANVIDANGQILSVHQALDLINQTLDEVLAEQEGDFDADTRWALTWFDQSGFAEGEFGVADVLARAKDTSVDGMVEAGILSASRGKVRLLKPSELPEDWDPLSDKRLTTWEMVHHLIRRLEASGENAAAELAAKLGTSAETARELCYRLYTICERKKRSAEAHSYNGLVQSWPEIARLAREVNISREAQQQTWL